MSANTALSYVATLGLTRANFPEGPSGLLRAQDLGHDAVAVAISKAMGKKNLLGRYGREKGQVAQTMTKTSFPTAYYRTLGSLVVRPEQQHRNSWLRAKAASQLKRARQLSQSAFIENPVTRLHGALDGLLFLKNDWNGYGSPKPTSESVRAARRLIRVMHAANALPDRVSASAEGGIALCFKASQRSADIEILNGRETLASTSDGRGDVSVWYLSEVGELKSIRRIKDFMAS
jgi:hypothetical protein